MLIRFVWPCKSIIMKKVRDKKQFAEFLNQLVAGASSLREVIQTLIYTVAMVCMWRLKMKLDLQIVILIYLEVLSYYVNAKNTPAFLMTLSGPCLTIFLWSCLC